MPYAGPMTERSRASREARTTMRKLRHDMRTPLGQIIGYTEMLEEELRERDQADLLPDLANVRRAAHTLLELVDGVFGEERVSPLTRRRTPSPACQRRRPRRSAAGCSS